MRASRIAVSVALAAAVVGCSDSPSAAGLELLELRLELSTEMLQAGQPLGMTLLVTNRSDRSVEITFPTACQENFLVRQGTLTVWELDAGRLCAQVVTELTLGPGETVTFQTTWDQVDNDGDRVPPGEYEAVGQLLSSPPRSSPPRPFSIADP